LVLIGAYNFGPPCSYMQGQCGSTGSIVSGAIPHTTNSGQAELSLPRYTTIRLPDRMAPTVYRVVGNDHWNRLFTQFNGNEYDVHTLSHSYYNV